MTRHYGRDELAAYIDANDAVVNVREVEAHLATCSKCTIRLEQVRQDLRLFAAFMKPPPRRETPPPEKAEAFAALSRQMRIEDAEAEEFFVSELVRHAREAWLGQVTSEPRVMSAGMVRRLTRAARDEEERAPRKALAILDDVEVLLDLIETPKATKDDLAGTLWKERANACMVIGDYPAALMAVDRAEAFYSRDVVADYFLAVTTWLRGTIFFEMGRYQEALVCAERAATTFHSFGDEERECQIQVLLGSIQYEVGDIWSAIRTFTPLLEQLRRFDDQLSVGRVLANLGPCYLECLDDKIAKRYTEEAILLFRAAGAETEVIRARWATGRAYLRRGDSERGIALLTRLAAEFRARELTVDAAEVDLDIIEEHLRHERFPIAAQMARDLVNTFTAADARSSAAKALSYLAEAAAGLRATPELVRRVRHVITHQHQDFHPADLSG